MRNVFLALVLVNLGCAAWYSWYAAPSRPASSPQAANPSIVLVSELPEELTGLRAVDELSVNLGEAVANEPSARAEALETQSAEPEPSAPAQSRAGAENRIAEAAPPETGVAASVSGAPRPTQCVSVGPFRELAQAASAAGTLRASGYQPSQRVAEGDLWIGYWVYIERIPTLDAANDILAAVRAEGITDAYVIPNSDSGNLVSLGVFSEVAGVTRRREEVRALGFEPTVVDRTRRATVYWIDIGVIVGETVDFDALQPPGRIIRLEQRACGPDSP